VQYVCEKVEFDKKYLRIKVCFLALFVILVHLGKYLSIVYPSDSICL